MADRIVTFGEVMLRLSPPGGRLLSQSPTLDVVVGGGEANVGIALAHLGWGACHVTTLPDSPTGQMAAAYLVAHRLDAAGLMRGGPRMGIYFLEAGVGGRASRVTYDRAGSSFAVASADSYDWAALLKGASWFHWTGITPGVSAEAAAALSDALDECQRQGIRVSADINTRTNLWGYGQTPDQVIPSLVARTHVLIGSKSDIKAYLGYRPADPSQDKYLPAAQFAFDTFGSVEACVNPKRDNQSASVNVLSAVGLTRGGELVQTGKTTVSPILDRIGGGDAFAAGLIWGLAARKPLDEALVYGQMSSVLKHYTYGDAGLASLPELEAAVAGDLSGRLIR